MKLKEYTLKEIEELDTQSLLYLAGHGYLDERFHAICVLRVNHTLAPEVKLSLENMYEKLCVWRRQTSSAYEPKSKHIGNKSVNNLKHICAPDLTQKNEIEIIVLEMLKKQNLVSLQQEATKEYDYPSRDDIENIFSKLLQKEKNIAFVYQGTNIRRNLMIRILEMYHNTEFSYTEMRIELNDRDTEQGIFNHFEYLKNNHFVESTTKDKFKFCNRVRKWKMFGQV